MQKLKMACAVAAAIVTLAGGAYADGERARGLGIPFDGEPGKLNAITDVPGVTVGQVTLISGEGETKVGTGPVRTGVTVVFPQTKNLERPVHAGFYNLNGNGEMTGLSYIEDFGVVYGPIGISNTNAIGDVYAAIQRWTSKRVGWALWPVVGETYDGDLHDIEGFHVTQDVVFQALDKASNGPVEEGNVGGGTGMTCFEFKGGIGTASRVVEVKGKKYTVGVLVQCNTGLQHSLRIAGVPVGEAMKGKWLACYDQKVAGSKDKEPICNPDGTGGLTKPDNGSIIIVVGTDAPLTPIQLNRVARRTAMGLGRMGSFAGNASGDLIVAFSNTGSPNDVTDEEVAAQEQLPNNFINTIFEATVQATEEAVVNALVAADTMTGRDGYTVFELPMADVQAILKQHNRLQP